MQARTAKEDLIIQIAEATMEKDKSTIARRIAIAANTMKWTETDLHALLAKSRPDSGIRNFTAFVKSQIVIKRV